MLPEMRDAVARGSQAELRDFRLAVSNGSLSFSSCETGDRSSSPSQPIGEVGSSDSVGPIGERGSSESTDFFGPIGERGSPECVGSVGPIGERGTPECSDPFTDEQLAANGEPLPFPGQAPNAAPSTTFEQRGRRRLNFFPSSPSMPVGEQGDCTNADGPAWDSRAGSAIASPTSNQPAQAPPISTDMVSIHRSFSQLNGDRSPSPIPNPAFLGGDDGREASSEDLDPFSLRTSEERELERCREALSWLEDDRASLQDAAQSLQNPECCPGPRHPRSPQPAQFYVHGKHLKPPRLTRLAASKNASSTDTSTADASSTAASTEAFTSAPQNAMAGSSSSALVGKSADASDTPSAVATANELAGTLASERRGTPTRPSALDSITIPPPLTPSARRSGRRVIVTANAAKFMKDAASERATLVATGEAQLPPSAPADELPVTARAKRPRKTANTGPAPAAASSSVLQQASAVVQPEHQALTGPGIDQGTSPVHVCLLHV
ncbi:hypothetical protein C8Q76DRAFT_688988 [Earliella scabrosa]|nr:hypothetical protein C8Q76DRAFT_688988 [Earliella scabrosa]